MTIINFLNNLIGRPPLDEPARPVHRDEHGNVDLGGGFYIPDPPPIQYVPEAPEEPMVADTINTLKKTLTSPRITPSSTSSLSMEYTFNLCGSTSTDKTKVGVIDKLLTFDPLPLKHFLLKSHPWILDVTEVRIKPEGRVYGTDNIKGPVEIHITVSPTHHSELMNPVIEKKVREKLYIDLLPLITCMFENNAKDRPIIIFSPIPTETILQCI